MSSKLRTSNGMLTVTNGKKLKQVIKLDLAIERNKVPFILPCQEITVSILDNPIVINVDKEDEEHALTIADTMSLEADISCFFITNEGSSGSAELWIWE